MPMTTNMAISLPTVGVTAGPTFATMINSAFDTVDAHDHTTGKGVKIPSAGININSDLAFNEYSATEVESVAFILDGTAAANRAAYVDSSGDLYYKNASGNAVQITDGGSIAAVGSGLITFTSPGAYPYSVTTSNAQQIVGIDTASARTIFLPAATNEMAFWIKDIVGSASSNNITITPDGSDTIEGAASNLLITEDFAARGLISDGNSAWYVF